MKYRICTITVVLLSLLFTSLNIQPSKTTAHSNMSDYSESPLQSKLLLPSMGEHITIFFHGLMVARYKPEMTRLEVGVVEAGGHEFLFQVWAGNRVPGVGVTTNQTIPAYNLYEFDVVYDSGQSTGGVLDSYRPYGSSFNRMNQDSSDPYGYSRDYRYLPDIEGQDMHGPRVDRAPKPFNYVFHVLKGNFQSKCLTGLVNKIRQSNENYGHIAEIAGVDITLRPHEKLVLRRRGETVPIWSCSYLAGKFVEARVINLPRPRLPQLNNVKKNSRFKRSNNDYISFACKRFYSPSTPRSHFDYYYDLVFTGINRGDRFRLESMERPQIKHREEDKSIFPYKCGMVIQSMTEDVIDENDLVHQ